MNMKSFPPQAGRPLHSVTRWVCLFAGALILCVLTCSEIFGQETSHCHDAAGRDIPCPPSQSPAGKKAIIFFSPGLSARDLTFIEGGGVLGWRERRQEEFDYLRAQGYSVTEEVGSKENILRALLDKEVRAISYFGHNAYEDKPTIEDDDAKGWKLKVSGELQRRYSRQGLSPDEAFRRAVAESQNFGLELVRNMSCWSLANTSLAQQFVKPSGRYFGVRSRFSPCRSPMTFCGISSCELEEYRVTVGQSTPAPAPPTSAPSSSGIGGTWSAPNGDTVSLTQSANGRTVTGSYRGTLGAGSVSGSFDGRTLSGMVQINQGLISASMPLTLRLTDDGRLEGQVGSALMSVNLILTRR